MERGLLFIPTPLEINRQGLRRDLYQYHRRLRLLDYFGFESGGPREPFTLPSGWAPREDLTSDPIRGLVGGDVGGFGRLSFRVRPVSNLSKEERKALEKLKSNRDIIIKPADKGSKIVILDKASYLIEANRQLENKKHYLPLKESIQMETQVEIRGILDHLCKERRITKKQKVYLYGEDPPRPRKFYLLPKIHKDPVTWTIPHKVPPGRPIVSDCGSESCRIAEYIDSFLGPLSQTHDSYIKDTYAFVDKLKTVEFPHGAMLFSIDVDALYTNIDTHLGLQAVQNILLEHPDPDRPDAAILRLLELGLTKNDFVFNDKYYLQIHGTAMGKKFAPAYANIYMAEFERTVLPKCPKLPTLYLRYLDDIFGVWPHGEPAFRDFMLILNQHHPSITFKYELHPEKINFLDTEVFVEDGEDGRVGLGTRVYFKPTDTHALLHRSSYHPRHTYRGIVKSQLIRFRRICVAEVDVRSATQALFQALRPRGYSRTFLRGIQVEVQQMFSGGGKPAEGRDEKHLVPLVTTYSPAALELNKIVKSNFKIAQTKIDPLREFRIIAAYRRNKNLRDQLVQASFKGTKRRDFLQPHFKVNQFITNKYTHLSAAVREVFQLDSSNLVYGIECKTCNKWYIGQTKNSLRMRLKQHLYSIRQTTKSTAIYVHFRDHGWENLLITGLESGTAWSGKRRLWRERIWINKLNTVYPNGLNEV